MSSSIAHSSARKKMQLILFWAALYNFAWGALVIAFPHAIFDWAGLPRTNYPEIWQCVGMIVGVYGLGYLIASWDPFRHWPIVLVGFLGKIFGPMGFIDATLRGVFNLNFGVQILTNDLIWWIPFFWILRQVWLHSAEVKNPLTETQALDLPVPNLDGKSLRQHSIHSNVIVVFVRHSGCTFCRQWLSQISDLAPVWAQSGHSLVIVTQSTFELGTALAAEYGLSGASIISDPDRRLYAALAFERATLRSFFRLSLWTSGFREAIVNRHGVGSLDGDGFQLGGYVILKRGQITDRWIAHNFEDQPNWSDAGKQLQS
jgi:hypothetical protein